MFGRESKSLKLSVQEIAASPSESEVSISKKIEKILPSLQKQFSTFKSFKLVKTESLKVKEGETGSILAIGSTPVSFTYIEKNESPPDTYKIKMSIVGGGADLSVSKGSVFYVGGPQLSGGSTLILAITVS